LNGNVTCRSKKLLERPKKRKKSFAGGAGWLVPKSAARPPLIAGAMGVGSKRHHWQLVKIEKMEQKKDEKLKEVPTNLYTHCLNRSANQ
jgi:hypothetical protein